MELPHRFAVSGGCHSIFCLEVAGESVSIGKSAGLTHLLNGEVRLFVDQTHGMIEAQLAN